MEFLLKYLKPYRIPFFSGIIFLSLEAACDLLQPTIMSNLIDRGVADKDLNYILTLSGIMLGVTFMGAVFALSRNYFASTVSQLFTRDLRLDVFKKVQYVSFDSIDQIEEASLITRLTNDVTQIQNFSYGMMRVFFKSPILFVGAVIMMFILDYKMALITLTVFPFAILFIILSFKIGYPFFMKVQSALDRMNTVLREYLTGVRVVKAFNSFGHEKERFAQTNISLSQATIKTMRIMAIFSPSIALAVNIGVALLLYFGAVYVNEGTLEVGKIMAFVMFMTQILNSLSMMTNIFNMLIRAKASSERIGVILSSPAALGIHTAYQHDLNSRVKLEFADVSFSYKGAKGLPVLRRLNFQVSSGQTVGMIGSTGAGKSTLLHLLMRYYDVTEGEIRINGTNIKEFNVHELRNLIGIVPQKNMLFSGSIRDNLLIGNENASEDLLNQAVKSAAIADFIDNLPEQYETKLGQGGVNLSGGQKQRLCIARALVKDAKILLFDDAFSAVDATTEREIRNALKAYMAETITFIITQRISSIMDCDKIIVLENGEITGLGSHEELISGNSVYQDIYTSQIGKGEA